MPVRRAPRAPWVVFAVSLVLWSCGGGGGDGGPTGNDNGFHPTSNTSLSGSVTYTSVNIPAGVTVTASSDLTMAVSGDVTIAGTLAAPCHALTLTAEGLLTVTGTIQNDC